MSKRKFGFEGFGISRKSTFEFEAQTAYPLLSTPSLQRNRLSHNVEDGDLDNGGDENDAQNSRNFMDKVKSTESNWSGAFREETELKDVSWFGINADDEDRNAGGSAMPEDDGELDPLDAFMEGIHEEVMKAPVKPRALVEELEDNEDDPTESFLKARRDAGLSLAAEALRAGYDSDEEVYAAAKAVDNGQIEYDVDDNAIVTSEKKKIESLAPLDHNDVDYDRFNKEFYEESASISGFLSLLNAGMTEEEVATYRKSLAIRVSGFDVPRPVKTFEDLSFDTALMSAIAKQGYERPTPIQCQSCPIILHGRDLIGIATTGSGKTAAFVLPMMVHIMDQPELGKGEGPIGVICAPTRELAQQIYSETKKFAKAYGIRISGVFGGMSKFEQLKELRAGCEIVVATPGRLIDIIKMKAMTMNRATYLVLDEADRMFDLGFECQIRSIVGQIRPDRQTLLFSATMPKRVERLAREILTDPVRVTVGEIGTANEDITQVVSVVPSDAEKVPWLLDRLQTFVDDGGVLVFASTKLRVEELERKISEKGFRVAALHGDKDQATRMEVLHKFKSGHHHILVATDVAARGLDIKSIKTVVNADIARDMDSHVHRIGRTGRAGDRDGVAHTLVTGKEARFAGELVTSLIAAGQNVPTELMDLAMEDGRYRSQREARQKSGGGGGARGGRGKGRGRGGGQGKGGRGGGGGRSVRGVDFGLGIGYCADSVDSPPYATKEKAPEVYPQRDIAETRGSVVDSLKVGIMARFKNSFVAASTGNCEGHTAPQATTPQGRAYGVSPSVNGRGRRNFASSGIGFGFQSGSSFTPGSSSAHTGRPFQGEGTVGRQDPSSGGAVNAGSVQAAASTTGDVRGGRNRSRWDRNRDQISIIQEKPVELSGYDNSNPTHQPDGERTRQRKRLSGWDR